MTMATTIQVEEKIKHKLEEMKLHPRETYNKVIDRLIKSGVEEGELSPQTIRHIEQALEDVKSGRVFSTKEVRKRLRLDERR